MPRHKCSGCAYRDRLWDGRLYCQRHRKWLVNTDQTPNEESMQFTQWIDGEGTEVLCEYLERKTDDKTRDNNRY